MRSVMSMLGAFDRDSFWCPDFRVNLLAAAFLIPAGTVAKGRGFRRRSQWRGPCRYLWLPIPHSVPKGDSTRNQGAKVSRTWAEKCKKTGQPCPPGLSSGGSVARARPTPLSEAVVSLLPPLLWSAHRSPLCRSLRGSCSARFTYDYGTDCRFDVKLEEATSPNPRMQKPGLVASHGRLRTAIGRTGEDPAKIRVKTGTCPRIGIGPARRHLIFRISPDSSVAPRIVPAEHSPPNRAVFRLSRDPRSCAETSHFRKKGKTSVSSWCKICSARARMSHLPQRKLFVLQAAASICSAR